MNEANEKDAPVEGGGKKKNKNNASVRKMKRMATKHTIKQRFEEGAKKNPTMAVEKFEKIWGGGLREQL